jgi:hypothetical protein
MDHREVVLAPEPDVSRRSFLQKAGLTGLAAAWASPIIQTVAAGEALANGTGPHAGTPQPLNTPSVQTPVSRDDLSEPSKDKEKKSEDEDSKDKKEKKSEDRGGGRRRGGGNSRD